MIRKHKRKIRKGYMGQIVRLSNKIAESKDEYILEKIDANAHWKEYVQGDLDEVNKKNKISLGGRDPRDNFHEEVEEEVLFYFLQQKFNL